jgi:G2/mitotic-specific cyclin-B3
VLRCEWKSIPRVIGAHEYLFPSRKRKAEISPIKNERVKRSALGNLTNAQIATEVDELIKKGILTIQPIAKKQVQSDVQIESVVPRIQPISSRTRAAKSCAKKTTKSSNNAFPPPQQRALVNEKNSKSKENVVCVSTAVKAKQAAELPVKTSRRISNEFEKTEESLYVSALEDIPSDTSRLSSEAHRLTQSSSNLSDKTLSSTSSSQTFYTQCSDGSKDIKSAGSSKSLPLGVEDFDRENWNDPFQVSHYAFNIFEYLKEREHFYKINDYISSQPELSKVFLESWHPRIFLT